MYLQVVSRNAQVAITEAATATAAAAGEAAAALAPPLLPPLPLPPARRVYRDPDGCLSFNYQLRMCHRDLSIQT